MIPVDKVRDIIKKHQSLEKELSSGAIEKKLFAAKSKEYSELNAVLCYAKEYLIFDKYINFGSNYEIDIKHDVQLNVCDKMDNRLDWMERDNIECNELVNTFNAVCHEIISKMKKSYVRFEVAGSNVIKIFPCCC